MDAGVARWSWLSLWTLPISVRFPATPSITNGLVAVSGQTGGIDVFGLPN